MLLRGTSENTFSRDDGRGADADVTVNGAETAAQCGIKALRPPSWATNFPRLSRIARIGGCMSEPSNKRRFLAPKARRGDGLGYVDMPALAMSQEPECLTEAEWELHVARDEKETEQEREQAFLLKQADDARRLLTFEERLTAATKEARGAKRRLDITSEVRLLRHMQQSGKEVRHLEQRLYVIERKVWRVQDKPAA